MAEAGTEARPTEVLLVPKLLLGNLIGCKALLCLAAGYPSVTFLLPSWSLAFWCVPKPELGNERK
jgi:hypothetical protein